MRLLAIFCVFLSLAGTSLAAPTDTPKVREAKMNALELGFFALPVLNMETAKAFYGSVMGWTFTDRDSKFAYIFANDKMIGALEIASDKLRPSEYGPLVYFRADFMEKTLARVTAGGGTVLEKLAMDGGTRGYTARILDPFKNVIAFWAPEN